MFFPSIYIFIVQLANEVAEVVVYNFSSSSQLNCQDNVGRQREQQVTSLCCRGESTEGSKRSWANPTWTDLTLSIMFYNNGINFHMWCLSFVKTLSIQYYCDFRSCSLPRRLLCVRQYPLQETMNVETLRAELAGQLANIFHVVKVSGAVVCVLILSSSAV